MVQSVWDPTNFGCIICRWKCISRLFQIISNITFNQFGCSFSNSLCFIISIWSLIIIPLITYNPTRHISKNIQRFSYPIFQQRICCLCIYSGASAWSFSRCTLLHWISLSFYHIFISFILQPTTHFIEGSLHFRTLRSTRSFVCVLGLFKINWAWQWLWYTASEATRSAHINNLFRTPETKVSFLSSNFFRILSINKTDSSFSPTRWDSGCHSGCSLSKLFRHKRSNQFSIRMLVN